MDKINVQKVEELVGQVTWWLDRPGVKVDRVAGFYRFRGSRNSDGIFILSEQGVKLLPSSLRERIINV